MALYLTAKCDGMMPPGSKERCRAGFSLQADVWISDDFGDQVADVDTFMDKAMTAGWTQDTDECDHTLHQFCPACTRHRAEGTA